MGGIGHTTVRSRGCIAQPSATAPLNHVGNARNSGALRRAPQQSLLGHSRAAAASGAAATAAGAPAAAARRGGAGREPARQREACWGTMESFVGGARPDAPQVAGSGLPLAAAAAADPSSRCRHSSLCRSCKWTPSSWRQRSWAGTAR